MTMHQLSGHEAGYLYADTTHSNSNLSLLHIYDQSTAPGGKVRFKTILGHLAHRLDRAPFFRQRLQRVPLGLDHPYWVEDESFDLEYHVRHIALPKPGDWRQFCIQVSRIHARALDLHRPLWEVYVIEGLDAFLDLPEGSFALMVKTHLAAVDVDHAGELTRLLHDLEPTPPPPPPPPPWFPSAPPGALSMALRGTLRSVTSPSRLVGPVARAVRQLAPAVASLVSRRLPPSGDTPVTRFHSVVSPHRVFDTRRFTLEEFDAIRALAPGATLNDAVLAVCGGALRRYLAAEGELPVVDLTAVAPRGILPGDLPDGAPPDGGPLLLALGATLADPVERLKAIQSQSHAPTAGRLPPASCVVSHLPGPAQPLYLCGARMTYVSGILPIVDGRGLAVAVTVYDGRVVVSPTSCRELMPRPEDFAQAIRDSFQELLALARRPGAGRLRPRRAAPSPAGRSARPSRKG